MERRGLFRIQLSLPLDKYPGALLSVFGGHLPSQLRLKRVEDARLAGSMAAKSICREGDYPPPTALLARPGDNTETLAGGPVEDRGNLYVGSGFNFSR